MPVTIRGVTYESRAAAGRALGLSSVAVLYAERDGRLDFVGTVGHKKPVTLEGITYESRADAARALGLSEIDVGRYLKVRAILTTRSPHDTTPKT